MEKKTEYEVELLVIDDTGKACISSEKNFLLAICANEYVWKNPEINSGKIIDNKLDICLRVKVADVSENLANVDDSQSMFFVTIKGKNFESLEAFRIRILQHLQRLGFRHIRILKDDISTHFAIQIYPLINKVENKMRSFLVKFFILKVGLDWWGLTAPKTVQDKVKTRKSNEPYFSSFIDTDVTLCDFDDLGELIYKQTTGFNSPDKIIDKIMKTGSFEDFEKLKSELQGNYTKYFKESFQDKNFANTWQQLFNIRNKVAHNNLMVIKDLEQAQEAYKLIEDIIADAEKLISNFTFSAEDRQAFFDASVEQVNLEAIDSSHVSPPSIKVVGKIDLSASDSTRYYKHEEDFTSATVQKIITEDILIEQIQYFYQFSSNVSLKGVAETLEKKGYDRKLIYSLANILVDKKILEFFTYENEFGWDVKGVRLVNEK